MDPILAALPVASRCVLVTASLPEPFWEALQSRFRNIKPALGPGLHRSAPGTLNLPIYCIPLFRNILDKYAQEIVIQDFKEIVIQDFKEIVILDFKKIVILDFNEIVILDLKEMPVRMWGSGLKFWQRELARQRERRKAILEEPKRDRMWEELGRKGK